MPTCIKLSFCPQPKLKLKLDADFRGCIELNIAATLSQPLSDLVRPLPSKAFALT